MQHSLAKTSRLTLCLLGASIFAPIGLAQAAGDLTPVIVTFSDGSQAELVSIAPHPSAPDQWWHPNGTAKPAPYDSMRSRAQGEFTREFCWRWVTLREGTVPRGFSVMEPRAVSFAGGVPRDTDGNLMDELSAAGMTFNVTEDPTTASVRFTAEVGRWRTVLTIDGTSVSGGSELLNDGRQAAYIAGAPLQVGDDLAVTVSVNISQTPLRVVAVDHNGKTIEGKSSCMSVNNMSQIATMFSDIDRKSIHGLRIEERDIEQATIRNVSLKRGKQTKVEIHDALTRLGEHTHPAKRGLDGRRLHNIRLEKVSPHLAKDAINSLGEAESVEPGMGFRAEIDDLRKRILLRCNDDELRLIRKFLTQLGEPNLLEQSDDDD